ncbi:MAG: hypothetical protein J7604_03570 [Sporocytophaga sp.]|uniref:hypothetical protein n=1 Tax=Sporocytophaga sp. TaxID=2231183 RepID=UPI001B294B95|nr:hypothetical protein [Sporocytophaga sp.]MBO9699260.1 hypothetical protein [Sporocytophaga sp.]
MRLVLFIIFITGLSFKAQSQKVARFDLVEGRCITVHGAIQYDNSNKPVDTTYYMFGRDSRYTQIYESVTLKYGGLKDIHLLLTKCLEVLNTEPKGVSITFDGLTITTAQAGGSKYLILDSIEKYSSGYTSVTNQQLKKIISDLEASCKESKLAYK